MLSCKHPAHSCTFHIYGHCFHCNPFHMFCSRHFCWQPHAWDELGADADCEGLRLWGHSQQPGQGRPWMPVSLQPRYAHKFPEAATWEGDLKTNCSSPKSQSFQRTRGWPATQHLGRRLDLLWKRSRSNRFSHRGDSSLSPNMKPHAESMVSYGLVGHL